MNGMVIRLCERFNLNIRLLGFLVVGGMNAAFGYSVFIIALWAGLHYAVAIAVATVLGVLFNFKSTGILVFRSRDNSRLLRFILVYGVVYVVNVAGVAAMLGLGIPAWAGGMLLVLPLALLSYSLMSRYVFPI